MLVLSRDQARGREGENPQAEEDSDDAQIAGQDRLTPLARANSTKTTDATFGIVQIARRLSEELTRSGERRSPRSSSRADAGRKKGRGEYA